jgi:hypothetical protein
MSSKINSTAQIRFLIWAVLTLFWGCKSQKNTIKSNTVLKITAEFQVPDVNGESMVIRDSQYIVYANPYLIHVFPQLHVTMKEEEDVHGNITLDTILSETIKNMYFIYKKGDTYGIKFDSLQVSKGTALSVDSFLRRRFHIDESIIFRKSDSLIGKAERDNQIIECYFRKVKGPGYEHDTSYLTMSPHFKSFPYSVTPLLDSVWNMRVIEIRLIFNPDISNAMPFFKKPRKHVFKTTRTDEMPDSLIDAVVKKMEKTVSSNSKSEN